MTHRGATTEGGTRARPAGPRDPAPMRVLVLGEGAGRLLGLRGQGHGVELIPLPDGGTAPSAAPDHHAIVLALSGTGRAGLDILRELRRRNQAAPVVLVTDRAAAEQRILGLGLGADACVTRPVHPGELAAQLRAVLRRAVSRRTGPIRHGALALDPITREAWCGGEPVWLTAREFALLSLLMRHPGTALGRDEIGRRAWGRRLDPRSNPVDVVVRRIRGKLGGAGPSPIETVRGVGYRVPARARRG